MEIHKLLKRQLKSLNLDPKVLPSDLNSWETLLEKVSRAYGDYDQDRYLMERSLHISSREMQERWKALDMEKAKSLHAEKFATLGEMAGSIAHEINNPIGLIGILTGQLKELHKDNTLDGETLLNSLDQVEACVWRVAKIIKALRRFSRDGSKDLMSLVPIKKIIEDVQVFCSERFKQNNIEFKISNYDENLKARCREVEICQVLLNLLNNSFDAIQESEERWIHLDITTNPKNIEFSVTNSGPKIPSEVQHKLFQPFFTTKDVGKGTGLGLSISKKIAENHGGHLIYDDHHPSCRFSLKISR